jgi:hypothetical protein
MTARLIMLRFCPLPLLDTISSHQSVGPNDQIHFKKKPEKKKKKQSNKQNLSLSLHNYLPNGRINFFQV